MKKYFPKGHMKSEWIHQFHKNDTKIWRISALRVFTAQRTEILILVIFWRIDDFINPFWLNLTFSSALASTTQNELSVSFFRDDENKIICFWDFLTFYYLPKNVWKKFRLILRTLMYFEKTWEKVKLLCIQ